MTVRVDVIGHATLVLLSAGMPPTTSRNHCWLPLSVQRSRRPLRSVCSDGSGTGAGRSSARSRRLPVVLRLGFPVIGVVDLPRAVTFWTAALDLVDTGEWRSEDWVTLHHADGSSRALGLQHSDSPREVRPRIHLDLFVDTTAEWEVEVERLVELGASKLDWDSYPPDPDFVVLGDPDGNPFCVVDLSRAPSGDHRASECRQPRGKRCTAAFHDRTFGDHASGS